MTSLSPPIISSTCMRTAAAALDIRMNQDESGLISKNLPNRR